MRAKADSDKGHGNSGGFDPDNPGSGGYYLCATADSVPASLTMVGGRKYQPILADGKDYQTGSKWIGWKCLRHHNAQPQHYQYNYKLGAPPLDVVASQVTVKVNRRWAAYARGDTDGDGVIAWFILSGYVLDDGDIVTATALAVVDGEE